MSCLFLCPFIRLRQPLPIKLQKRKKEKKEKACRQPRGCWDARLLKKILPDARKVEIFLQNQKGLALSAQKAEGLDLHSLFFNFLEVDHLVERKMRVGKM